MIDTRLTRQFGLTCPVVLAPMHRVAGGRLAAAVTRAGGLGLIGGGDCDPEWIEAQFHEAGEEAVGCGLTTSRLAETPDVLDRVLEHRPRAVYLAHGDPRPFAARISQAGARLICQIQDLEAARLAIEADAAVIVAQGNAAGGSIGQRSTMTLVPELADILYREAHDTLLLAAGGIADSRGLAAAIVMGADGVVMGTRLWASKEALVHPDHLTAVLNATGDDTVRVQAAAGLQDMRVLKNTDEAAVGEGIGVIHSAPPVEDVLNSIARKAERLLTHVQRKVIC